MPILVLAQKWRSRLDHAYARAWYARLRVVNQEAQREMFNRLVNCECIPEDFDFNEFGLEI